MNIRIIFALIAVMFLSGCLGRSLRRHHVYKPMHVPRLVKPKLDVEVRYHPAYRGDRHPIGFPRGYCIEDPHVAIYRRAPEDCTKYDDGSQCCIWYDARHNEYDQWCHWYGKTCWEPLGSVARGR